MLGRQPMSFDPAAHVDAFLAARGFRPPAVLVAAAPAQPAAPPRPHPATEPVRALVQQAGARLVQLEQDRLRRAAKGPGGIAARAAGFYAQHQEHLDEGLLASGTALAALLAGTRVPNGQDLLALTREAVKATAAGYCAAALLALEDPRHRTGQGLEDLLKAWAPDRQAAELARELEHQLVERLNRSTP